jgi:chromate transporter
MTTAAALARDEDDARATVSFGEALRFWLRLGFISFGGPAGQIAIMHASWSSEKRWISSGVSCTRSTTACCCPGPRRSSSPPTSAG